VIDLDEPENKEILRRKSVTGLVPVLNHGSLHLYDSLAISEYLNELSNGALFPDALKNRAIARSLCSELHSGFTNIRSELPFSLKPNRHTSIDRKKIANELDRLVTIFESATLPFMFDKESAVDAFYAVMAFRLKQYGVILEGKADQYQDSLIEWQRMKKAVQEMNKWKGA
jgi:glutathione S-transferase